MKGFLKHTLFIIIALIVAMILLEVIYTTIYNSGSYRNKVMWIRDMEPDTLDYALFGSSRVKYLIDPLQIEKEINMKGVNLGMNAAGPFETHMAVNTFFKNSFAKKIFVQVDYTYYTEAPDSIGQLVWLPHIKEKDLFKHFKPYGKGYVYLKKIPMYRYLKFEGQLGFRNVTLSALGKKPDFLESKGFKSMTGNLQKDTIYPYTLERKRNKQIDEIIKLANNKNIELYFFTAPIYKPEEGFSILQSNLPNYKNMSTAVTDITYFYDHLHLNEEGAALFTDMFITEFLK